MRKIAGIVVALLVASLVPASAFAWGAVAHRYITRRAVDLLPDGVKPFFDRFRDELALRSNDPDLWRLMFPEEAPNHHLDFGVGDYGPYPFTALPRELDAAIEKFGTATVRRHGLLPWRVEELFGNLRRAFEGFKRNQPYVAGNTVLYSAALAHYIQDGHQPLHMHNNFDGRLTGQNGIHSRFESELFERFESRLTINPVPVRPIANARDFIFDVALNATQLVPQILRADKEAADGKGAYDAEYFEAFLAKTKVILEQQLASSITATASAIVAAWEHAGRPVLREEDVRPVEKVRRP